MRQIRAIIYGVGNVNQIATRLMVEKGVRVVGALNRPGPKVGKDLGELAGLSQPLGVTVSDDAAAVLATPADIVLVAVCDDMQRGFPIYKECLEHKLNVVTVGAFMSYPWRQTPEPAGELDALAKAHGVSLVATGNQDFFIVNLGLLMSGVCHRVERIIHRSLSNIALHGTEVAELMGVGKSPEMIDGSRSGQPPSIYIPFWENVAHELGITVLDVKQTTEPVIADKTYCCDGFKRGIEAGKVIGLRQRLEIKTTEGLELVGDNTLCLCEAGVEEYKEWVIEGAPGLKVRATRLDSAFTTATQAVARIPDAINAEPGYVTLKHLPKLIYRPKPLSSYLHMP